MATEEELFESLYRCYWRQGASVFRHASVGEAYQYVTRGHENRAQHSIRRIDALVMRRSVAKGDSLWAVEIKVSASDLKNELSTPEKTAAWAQYADAFYFLVPDTLVDLAKDLVPQEYGIMTPANRWSTTIVRRAKKNPNPLPLPMDTWRRLAGKLGDYQMEAIQKKK